MFRNCLGILLVVACLLTCAMSCNQPAKHVDHSTHSGGESSHWVHEEQLYRVMTVLHRETSPNVDERGAVDYDRAGEFVRTKDTARWLSGAAARIPDAVADSDMTEEDRLAFDALARELQFTSWDLYEQAAARDVEGMHAAYDRISLTCNSCHNQFREWAGPLESR